ncbi:AAA family ATPase [Microbacterium paraoxydans]|uniref:MinD/ParA family ATP-binding protein n=1 Tax=Microbacterium paraoxydans TaxID=199592 RepID=UPI003D70D238
MTTKKTDDPEENPLGVLDDTGSIDTAGISILGGTAQVRVTLPIEEDDDLVDDSVVEGEVVGELLIDELTLPGATVPVPASAITISSTSPVEGAAPAAESPGVPPTAADAAPAARAALPPEFPADGEPEVTAEETTPAPASVDTSEPVAPSVTKPSPEPEVQGPEAADGEAELREADAEAPLVDVIVEDEDEDEDEQPEPDPSAHDEIREAVVFEPAPHGAASDGADDSGRAAEEEAAAARFIAKADADAVADRAASSVVPGSSPRKEPRMSTPDNRSVVRQAPRAAAAPEVTLASKRLGELSEAARESADLLTADRLLDPHHVSKPEPEGGWSHFLYTVSGRRINIGDGRRARERKALTARIGAPLTGGARFIPVLSRKGGVGKTTITALLGMALADAREDRVIAVDANPDRGTLADRVARPQHGKSVRDLVRIRDEVRGYHDISAIVARDATRLDVLASDADPHVAEAFSDTDYRDVAAVAAHYYSLVLTDTGTGIVHSVMSATLDLADQLVIVSGLSVDEARLASETLTWLETNGYTEQARDAIVVLNQSTPGTPLVRLNELQAHFATRVRSVVRVPYDPQIAGGGSIVFANLLPETRTAARELAALLVEGLRARAA